MTRKATIQDLDQVTNLFDQYVVFYKNPSNFEKHKSYLKERMENDEATIFLAFEESNLTKAIGFVLIYVTFSSLALSKIIILNDIYVDPVARKIGVGEKLITETANFGKEIGAYSIRLRTSKSNKVAQAIYNKMGFVMEDHIYGYELKL